MESLKRFTTEHTGWQKFSRINAGGIFPMPLLERGIVFLERIQSNLELHVQRGRCIFQYIRWGGQGL
jgi:hypothetical protein